MIRLAPLLAALLLVCGCGSDGGTKTVTTTDGGSKPGMAPGGGGPSKLSESGGAPAGERIRFHEYLAFETPSGRIACAVTTRPATLRCDTEYETRYSRTGKRCEFGDYGHAFLLRRSGRARPICASDTVLSAGSKRTIPYGKTWFLGPYSCTSLQTGLSCRNPEGHGLSLSFETQKVF